MNPNLNQLYIRANKLRKDILEMVGPGRRGHAAMFSTHYKLDNVIAVVDKNNIQAMGFTCDRMNMQAIDEKFQAFGWEVYTVNGHNIEELIEALDRCDKRHGKPKVIIASTIKGKGLKIGENTSAFHNNELTEEQYLFALEDISREIGELNDGN